MTERAPDYRRVLITNFRSREWYADESAVGLADYEAEPLNETEQRDTSEPMDRDLLDAKIEASEARTDAKFAELKGLLAAVPSRWDVWGGLLALFVAILGILAFGSDRLALGVGLADTRQEQLERDRQQDATANEINAKLDRLLAETSRPTK